MGRFERGEGFRVYSSYSQNRGIGYTRRVRLGNLMMTEFSLSIVSYLEPKTEHLIRYWKLAYHQR